MKEQIKKRIKDYEEEYDKLDSQLFYIDMIDRWTDEDKKNYDKCHDQMEAIKKEIEILKEQLNDEVK